MNYHGGLSGKMNMKQMRTKKDLDGFWDLAQNLPVTSHNCKNTSVYIGTTSKRNECRQYGTYLVYSYV